MVRFTILTLFPDSIRPYIGESILRRAIEAGHIAVDVFDIRDFTEDKHHKADDKPFGGGPGMVLKAEPILKAVQEAKRQYPKLKTKILIMAPGGAQFSNITAKKFSKAYGHIILIAGRYEGIDARVKKVAKAEELSIGPYVLSGGELPALVILEAIARQVPGVLGKEESIEENRHGAGVPAYTRPEIIEWEGKKYKAPPVLLSGDHKKIEEWRASQSSK